jgi:hypothetical protein
METLFFGMYLPLPKDPEALTKEPGNNLMAIAWQHWQTIIIQIHNPNKGIILQGNKYL